MAAVTRKLDGQKKKKKNCRERKQGHVLTLAELAAIIVAEHFDKSYIDRLPAEAMELVQKQMSRENQIRFFNEYREWHENGQLRKLQHFKDGREHGVCIKWWPNGRLWHKKECRNGELCGQRKLWYKTGQLKWYAHYEDNHVNGECKWWHSNGQLRSHAFYKNNQLHGEYKFFNKRGGVWSEGVYLYGYRFEKPGFFASLLVLPIKLLGQL